MDNTELSAARTRLLHKIASELLVIDEYGIASNAHANSAPSRRIALHIARNIGATEGRKLTAQTASKLFEKICCNFIEESLAYISQVRPCQWTIKQQPSLEPTLDNNYSIAPDIIVYRKIESGSISNSNEYVVDGSNAKASSFRPSNNEKPHSYATISCKWSMCCERAQTARSEVLNLTRQHEIPLAHIVAVTAEPTPARIASLALGTPNLDCVYHFALYELVEALDELKDESAAEQLAILIEEKRLKDISDLPFNLCV